MQKEKRTIALLTDFGIEDNYVGIMKGVIYNINPNVNIVDISHAIRSQNILKGSLVLRAAYRFFPQGTIFVCVVDPGVGTTRKPIVVQTKNYYFVAPDNGLLAPILDIEKPKQIRAITNDEFFLAPISRTFHGRDLFSPTAAHISKGVALSRFGAKQSEYIKMDIPQPLFNLKKKRMKGEVIDVDRFGNLITNIEAQHLEKWKANFTIRVQKKVIPELSHSYQSVDQGGLLAIIGSQGFLEISVNHGSASLSLKAKKGAQIEVLYD